MASVNSNEPYLPSFQGTPAGEALNPVTVDFELKRGVRIRGHVTNKAKELQRRLKDMDVIQREEYPSLHGRSRLAVYPGLKHSGRADSRQWERQHWRLDLVLEHLAGYAVPRQVDISGSVSVYNKTYYVGKRYTGKMVYVSVDPSRREWLFRDAQGNHVRTQPAEQLCQERIVTLTVSDRRQRSGRSN